ncbi:thiaminase II [Hoyosella subflava]|uniref:Aminopyrimidine aminohydrolase n=1 Tax=Hoyosella subflava (strain DSM 45089 / JCM 17490 / NBRC 109087 / DQS3-9A1) TaxID=443218 RepID=F6EK26_HOYSD|nr:thiaminase II [Hoyosella subflava]AEF41384.1 Transcriptional activator, TenA family [Hoyosella subflava DQS3-9A1]
MIPLSDALRSAADGIWQAQHNHPFVRGLGDGSLDAAAFRLWIRQDYLFLIEYSRLCALAAARAPDLETMRRFAELLHETLNVEMDLHRSYCTELGITEAELEREERAPTTQGYTDFLLRSAAVGDFAELLAALLPCMWGFSEIGTRLAETGLPQNQGYAKWISMYSSREFTDLVAWLRELTNEIGAELSGAARERVRNAFMISSRYELAFWEMAWTRQEWPAH